MPCSTCRNDNQGFRPQSRETKRLVLPKNRYRQKQLGKIQQEQPCRRCFQTNCNCFLISPKDSKCEGCRKANLRCNWSLERARKSTARQERRKIEKQARHERLGFVPVPRDKKCYRCAERIMACDRKVPCNRCSESLQRVSYRP